MNALHEHSLVSVIWCDDIREEVGNKLSFMGVYSHLVVPSLPFVIQRLAAHITIYTPVDKPLKSLAFRVLKSDESQPIASGELPIPSREKTPPSDDPPAVNFCSIGVLLGNVEVTEKTKWLKVEVDTGDETLASLRLRIADVA